MMLTERLRNHRLAGNGLAGPVDVVRWHGAVQAQDFPGALWAVAQRVVTEATEADVLAAFDAGALIRTHVLRPTWHFVAPEDLRWMLALTAPRLQAGSAARYAAVGLDATTRAKATRTIARALEGGRHLTRHELAAALRRVRIDPDGQRLMHLLFHAELEGLICSGPRVGKDLTYALLDERVAPAPPRDREDSLATLMTRYFASHGPATVRDAAWWSGLPLGAVREGIALAGDALERRVIGDTEHWAAAGAAVPPAPARARARATRVAPTLHLLPSYDEYTVAYRDRTALLHASTSPSTVGAVGAAVAAGDAGWAPRRHVAADDADAARRASRRRGAAAAAPDGGAAGGARRRRRALRRVPGAPGDAARSTEPRGLGRLVRIRQAPRAGCCAADRVLGSIMTITARVRAGRLVVDEPTTLPEGTEVALLPLDPGDWLDDNDRAALHAALEASDSDVAAGRLVDAEVVLRGLRAR